MRHPQLEKTQLTSLLGIFSMIMMAVFAAEVMVMQLYSGLLHETTIYQMAFLDASTLIFVISLPLWFFVFRPAFREKFKGQGGYVFAAFSLYLKVLAGLYLIQLGIMFYLPVLMPVFDTPPSLEHIVDGALTVVLSGPLFWWLLYRLELHYRLEPLADFLNAPATLYVLLLFMIFLADLVQEILFPHLILPFSKVFFQVFDGFVTVLFIAPLLYLLVVRPLRRLAQSERARTDAIYDQVVDAIIKIDQGGTIASFNLAAQQIFGLSAEQVIGSSASALLDSRQIDLSAALEQLVFQETSTPLDFHEITASRSDGSSTILDVSLSKIQFKGSQEFLLLLRDISERKATEDALLATDAIFREIFNQTEDAILFFELGTGKILDVNITTERLYGFSQSELQIKGVGAFCDDETYPRFMELLQTIETQGQGQIDKLINHPRGGEPIVVSVRGKIVSLKGSQVIYFTVRDISERVRLEDEAREIQAKLIQTNKMTSLGLLVSGVAHEINNPNNLVLSSAQLLERVWKDAQLLLTYYYRENGEFLLGGMPFSELEQHTPEIFHGITDGSRRINAIVNDLKRFAREDPNRPADEVDINKVVTESISMLHHELVIHTANFNLNLADEMPLVLGSRQQLGQVIINLLMNAFQALPDKNSAVWLTTQHNPLIREVIVSVRDQGVGLPPEFHEKLFEPFFTTKLETGGTGLGLSISQSIIKEHGGHLEFSSPPEGGTIFTVKLPAV